MRRPRAATGTTASSIPPTAIAGICARMATRMRRPRRRTHRRPPPPQPVSPTPSQGDAGFGRQCPRRTAFATRARRSGQPAHTGQVPATASAALMRPRPARKPRRCNMQTSVVASRWPDQLSANSTAGRTAARHRPIRPPNCRPMPAPCPATVCRRAAGRGSARRRGCFDGKTVRLGDDVARRDRRRAVGCGPGRKRGVPVRRQSRARSRDTANDVRPTWDLDRDRSSSGRHRPSPPPPSPAEHRRAAGIAGSPRPTNPDERDRIAADAGAAGTQARRR